MRERILHAEEYLKGLEAIRQVGWYKMLSEYRDGNLSIPKALALIHPEHYDFAQDIVCGVRTFKADPVPSLRKCECHLYWQIICPFSKEREFRIDHIFPYSLGGPTDPDNRMVLCRLHNQMKSNDIHFFPWEQGLPIWFEPLLSRIELRKLID